MVYLQHTSNGLTRMDESNQQYNGPASAQRNPYALPAAIIIGFSIIAAAIYFGGNNTSGPVAATAPANNQAAQEEVVAGPIRPIDDTDHIRGNPNAPIVIVEYSDFDCPFCKNFHDTMIQVVENYGVNGDVAWVYRHFPIEQLHPGAKRVAAAAECVAELAGNDAFWKFTDLAFGERGINEPTNASRLTEFAVTAGASQPAFEECLSSGRTMARVDADIADALSAGAQGTPYSLVVVGEQQGPINGAQPYGVVSQIIETLLGQIRNQ
jgi:protein-disulfide isomerase